MNIINKDSIKGSNILKKSCIKLLCTIFFCAGIYEILKTDSVRQNAVSLLFFKIQESFFKRIGINKGFYPI